MAQGRRQATYYGPFNFNFGPPPPEGGRIIEAMPLALAGLKDANAPTVRPLASRDEPEDAEEVAPSLPPGYRGVRPGGRAAEVVEIFAPRESKTVTNANIAAYATPGAPTMRVIVLNKDPQVIRRILRRLGRWVSPPRTAPRSARVD